MLSFANLSSANLNSVNLRSAVLSSANLDSANFAAANLTAANFSYADLRAAVFNGANLSAVNLSSSIVLGTDFQRAKSLTSKQFEGDSPPYLCKAALPNHVVNAGINPNRDCAQMPKILSDRNSEITLEEAQRIVEEARQL